MKDARSRTDASLAAAIEKARALSPAPPPPSPTPPQQAVADRDAALQRYLENAP